MNREKQIEEMAKIFCGMKNGCDGCMWDKAHCNERNYAEEIYNAGYRKQSEPFSQAHENDGEWKSKHHMSRSPRGRYTSYNTYSCNVCGKANGRRKTPFCPNCGAKMKGGAE